MKNKIFCIITILLLSVSSVGPSLVAAEPFTDDDPFYDDPFYDDPFYDDPFYDSNQNIADKAESASGHAYALKGGYDGNINKELDDPYKYTQQSEGQYIPKGKQSANLVHVNMTKVADHFDLKLNVLGPTWSINGSNLTEYFTFVNETGFNKLLKDNRQDISNKSCYNATYDSEMVKIRSIHPNATIMNLTINFNTSADPIFIPYVLKNQDHWNKIGDVHIDGIITFPYNSTYLYNVYKEELMEGIPIISYGEWIVDGNPTIEELGNNTFRISQNYTRTNTNVTPITHNIINITYDQDDAVIFNNSYSITKDNITNINQTTFITDIIHTWRDITNNTVWGDWGNTSNTDVLDNGTLIINHTYYRSGETNYTTVDYTNTTRYNATGHVISSNLTNNTIRNSTPLRESYYNNIKYWDIQNNITTPGEWVLVNVSQEVIDLGNGFKKVITHNTYNRTNTINCTTNHWREIISNKTGTIEKWGPGIFINTSEIKDFVESIVKDVVDIIEPTRPEPEPEPEPVLEYDGNSSSRSSSRTMIYEDENVDMAEFVCT